MKISLPRISENIYNIFFGVIYGSGMGREYTLKRTSKATAEIAQIIFSN
jgi:hypothetical protein